MHSIKTPIKPSFALPIRLLLASFRSLICPYWNFILIPQWSFILRRLVAPYWNFILIDYVPVCPYWTFSLCPYLSPVDVLFCALLFCHNEPLFCWTICPLLDLHFKVIFAPYWTLISPLLNLYFVFLLISYWTFILRLSLSINLPNSKIEYLGPEYVKLFYTHFSPNSAVRTNFF